MDRETACWVFDCRFQKFLESERAVIRNSMSAVNDPRDTCRVYALDRDSGHALVNKYTYDHTR